MRIAYLDCFSGISGDMFLGALVDAGVSPDLLKETVRRLNIGAELEITRVDRNGITATKVDVIVGGVKDIPSDVTTTHSPSHESGAHAHEHSHSHAHEHTHADGTTHSHEHWHTHSHPHVHDDPSHAEVRDHALPHDPEHAYHDGPQVHAHDHRVPGSATAATLSSTAVPDVHEHTHTHIHSHEHTHPDGTTHAHDHSHTHTHPHGHDDGTHVHGHELVLVNDADHAYHDAPEVHAHKHWHGEESHDHPHRGLREIRAIIGRAEIPARAKERALAIFQSLGKAEAKIHNKDLDSVHFHEVGAVDAIVDIVCAAVGAESLGVEKWLCSPLNVGSGVVQCAHGTLPVPAPATLELLKNVPVYSSGIQRELVTPTGAAIAKTLVARFGELPGIRISSVGYGAGARNLRDSANVLRITIGEATDDDSLDNADSIKVIEANLDDLNPQVFGYVIDRLLAEGALDAFGTPVQMKKGRPGIVLTVLARAEDEQRMAEIIFNETTTIGLRIREENRQTLRREWLPVETPWGEVRIKIARFGDKITNYAPEFEDCRRIAGEHDVPLKSVMQEAVRVYLQQRVE